MFSRKLSKLGDHFWVYPHGSWRHSDGENESNTSFTHYKKKCGGQDKDKWLSLKPQKSKRARGQSLKKLREPWKPNLNEESDPRRKQNTKGLVKNKVS